MTLIQYNIITGFIELYSLHNMKIYKFLMLEKQEVKHDHQNPNRKPIRSGSILITSCHLTKVKKN